MVTIGKLEVCGSEEPLGIDDEKPVFSWQLSSKERGKSQSAYRIVVKDGFVTVWDSGKVDSANACGVLYGGAALKSKTVYCWFVKVWDENGAECGEGSSWFETGLMRERDALSCWIGVPPSEARLNGAAPLLRKTFFTPPDKKVKTARVYIAGLGLFDLKINGENPDDSLLNPANTDYDKTVLYNVFDVTGHIKAGENAMCAELGNGFYNESINGWGWSSACWRNAPKLRLELDIFYTDGAKQSVISDSSWKYSLNGPTVFNSIYCGEVIDARKSGGFSLADYDDALWRNASIVSPPNGRLVWQNMEAIRKIRTYSVADGIEVTFSHGIKKHTVKLPRNVAGWSRIAFCNTVEGQRITIDYGETLLDDGNVKKHVEEGIFQRDIYVCKGCEKEFYEPKFNYKGFRFIQIEGYNGLLCPNDIECYEIHNDVAATAEIKTPNGLVNELHGLMINTLLNNFHGKPTDTPRLEKNGWLGDVNMAVGAMCFNFDVRRFMTKFLNDIRDGQQADGSIPQMVPTAGFGLTNAPAWNSVYVFAIEALCDFYGMNRLIPEYYDSVKKLCCLDISVMKERGWIWGDEEVLGDWVSPAGSADGAYDEYPAEGGSLVATAYVYKMLKTAAKFADMQGKRDDFNLFGEASRNILAAFNDKFLKDGVYDTGWSAENHNRNRTRYRQTSNILPLAFGMVPQYAVEAVVENLVKDVKKKDYHLDTGIIGTKYILPVLCDYGYRDIALRILTQTTYPSWGYWVKNGATTLWEMWETTSRSRNHYFLGTYDEWLFGYLGGIKEVKDGYGTFTLEPIFFEEFANFEVSVKTVRGGLYIKRRLLDEGEIRYDLTVPFGSKATFRLTEDVSGEVRADGLPLACGNGIDKIVLANGKFDIILGGGVYTFTTPQPKLKTNTLN